MPDRTGDVERCDLLVRNATVITMDEKRRVFRAGAVAVTGHTIVDVGPDRELSARYRALRAIDAGGAAVHPGFIDAHLHVVHISSRGIFGDVIAAASERVTFADWKASVTPEDERAATAHACVELLRNGFTAFVEPGTVFDNDAVAEAAQTAGVRALLSGCYLWDQAKVLEQFPALRSRALLERAPPSTARCLEGLGSELHRNRAPAGLVRGHVSVYGLGTASDELLREGKALADAHGVAFHQHEGYVPSMSSFDEARLGRSRIAHLQDLGVLDGSSTLVHLNVLDDADADRLVGSGASAVWCPVAYLKLGLGDTVRSRHPELKQRGVNVALGLDGAGDCSTGDAAHVAQLVAKHAGAFVSAGDVLEMKTIGAARSAKIDALAGSIEVGKRADLVVCSSAASEAWPGVDHIAQLALLHRTDAVDSVIVNGEIVMKNGRSTRLDEVAVFADARESVRQRMARLDLGCPTEWPVLG